MTTLTLIAQSVKNEIRNGLIGFNANTKSEFYFEELSEEIQKVAVKSFLESDYYYQTVNIIEWEIENESYNDHIKCYLGELGFTDIKAEWSVAYSQGDYLTVEVKDLDWQKIKNLKEVKALKIQFNKYFLEFLHDADITLTGINYTRRNSRGYDYNDYYFSDNDYKKGYEDKLESLLETLVEVLDSKCYEFYHYLSDFGLSINEESYARDLLLNEVYDIKFNKQGQALIN